MIKTILCFGDSNTYGYDAIHDCRFDENTRWTKQLAHTLGANYCVIEEGLCGRNAACEDPDTVGLCGKSYFIPCISSHSPLDLIIIMLGTNDAKDCFSLSPQQIADNIGSLAELAVQASIWHTQPHVLLVAPVCPDARCLLFSAGMDGYETMEDLMGTDFMERTRLLPQALKKTAHDLGCHYLDPNEKITISSGDYLHLSPSDHHTLAHMITEKVNAIL